MFTTPCFIRKNTPELFEELRDAMIKEVMEDLEVETNKVE